VVYVIVKYFCNQKIFEWIMISFHFQVLESSLKTKQTLVKGKQSCEYNVHLNEHYLSKYLLIEVSVSVVSTLLETFVKIC
jgi:uncharacterized membrane protein